MEIDTLRIITTCLMFVTVIGIIFWAWSRKRKPDFNEAANLPFNEPDQPAPISTQHNNTGEA